jgi:DNA-directed RNA polymerase subunit RPC12/RpoP
MKVLLEYRPSSKDGANDRFDLKGPDADECVKHDAMGLRITLPAGHVGARPETGLRVQVDVRGDFEITMSFDLLHEPGPLDAGFGTRTTLGLWLDGPEQNRDVTISRLRNNQGFTRFGGWAPTLIDEFGNKQQRMKYIPAEAKIGRVRLVREGAEISYYVVDGAEGAFQLFSKNTVTAGDVRRIRMVATTGGPKAKLDVRITELVVRAESFPDLPANLLVPAGAPLVPAGAPNAEVAAPPPIGLGWPVVAAAGAFAVLLIVGMGIAILLYARRARTAQPAEAPDVNHTRAQITFACAGCGRQVNVKPELAGKKVKCSRCGAIALATPQA